MSHDLLPLLQIKLARDEELVVVENLDDVLPVRSYEVVVSLSGLLHKLSEKLDYVLVHHFLFLISLGVWLRSLRVLDPLVRVLHFGEV